MFTYGLLHVYVRAEARTLQRPEFFRSLFSRVPMSLRLTQGDVEGDGLQAVQKPNVRIGFSR
jgi:hypothetical protein